MFMNVYNKHNYIGVHENMLSEKSPQLSPRSLSRVVRELMPAESPEPHRFLEVGGSSGGRVPNGRNKD